MQRKSLTNCDWADLCNLLGSVSSKRRGVDEIELLGGGGNTQNNQLRRFFQNSLSSPYKILIGEQRQSELHNDIKTLVMIQKRG